MERFKSIEQLRPRYLSGQSVPDDHLVEYAGVCNRWIRERIKEVNPSPSMWYVYPKDIINAYVSTIQSLCPNAEIETGIILTDSSKENTRQRVDILIGNVVVDFEFTMTRQNYSSDLSRLRTQIDLLSRSRPRRGTRYHGLLLYPCQRPEYRAELIYT